MFIISKTFTKQCSPGIAGFYRIFHNVDKRRYILPEISDDFTFKTVIKYIAYVIKDPVVFHGKIFNTVEVQLYIKKGERWGSIALFWIGFHLLKVGE